MATALTESEVETAALAWLERLDWQIKHGPGIAPHGPRPERADYTQVVLEDRLHQALVRLTPELPAEALDDAFRRLTRPGLRALPDRRAGGQAGGAIRGVQAARARLAYRLHPRRRSAAPGTSDQPHQEVAISRQSNLQSADTLAYNQPR